MGFSTFKANYISKINSGGFGTSDETAEFIASEYDAAVSLPTSIATVSGPIATPGGGTTTLESYLKSSFAAGTLPPVLELGMVGGLSAYWTGVITSAAFSVVTPGTPTLGGNLTGNAETVEDFLDQLVGVFEMHLGGLAWANPSGVTDVGWNVL